MTERILHLTLKKKWFDLIKSGEKKIEYREKKPYWKKRFFKNDGAELKPFDFVIFTNGYRKDSPKIKVEWKGISLGDFEGKECWKIHLGKVIE